jgi:hypothetical protein
MLVSSFVSFLSIKTGPRHRQYDPIILFLNQEVQKLSGHPP